MLLHVPWYAIRTKTNRERVAAAALEKRGYEQYVPVYRRQRQWSDRVVHLDQLIFPGYVFCRFDATVQRSAILTTPGVTSIVTLGGEPAPIPDFEIDAIQKTLGSGFNAEPYAFFRDGQRVQIKRGPLKGIRGTLVQTKKGTSVVISIAMLQRSVAVHVDSDIVAPILEDPTL